LKVQCHELLSIYAFIINLRRYTMGQTMETEFRHLTPEGAGVGFGWLAQDLHPAGATGVVVQVDPKFTAVWP
jgi:hypothetical protein